MTQPSPPFIELLFETYLKKVYPNQVLPLEQQRELKNAFKHGDAIRPKRTPKAVSGPLAGVPIQKPLGVIDGGQAA